MFAKVQFQTSVRVTIPATLTATMTVVRVALLKPVKTLFLSKASPAMRASHWFSETSRECEDLTMDKTVTTAMCAGR